MSNRYQEGFCAGYRKALVDFRLCEDESGFLRDHRVMMESWWENWRQEQARKLQDLAARRGLAG